MAGRNQSGKLDSQRTHRAVVGDGLTRRKLAPFSMSGYQVDSLRCGQQSDTIYPRDYDDKERPKFILLSKYSLDSAAAVITNELCSTISRFWHDV